MSTILRWFADKSDSWDKTGQNDAGMVLNLIAGILEGLGA